LAAERDKLGHDAALITARITVRVAEAATANEAAPRGSPVAPILGAVMHMKRFVVVQREDEWLATYRERKQVAQNCRDLAKHTLPGELRDQLLEIATMWEIIERSDLVQ
jgi:hypothetical protein